MLFHTQRWPPFSCLATEEYRLCDPLPAHQNSPETVHSTVSSPHQTPWTPPEHWPDAISQSPGKRGPTTLLLPSSKPSWPPPHYPDRNIALPPEARPAGHKW